MILHHLVRTTAFLFLVSPLSFAGDWQNWRGPHHNGTADAHNLPATLDPAKDVKWETAVPGPSSATPIVSGDRVFLVSHDSERRQLFALCFDRSTGKLLWQKKLAEVSKTFGRNDMASASPVTDGKTVYFMIGTSDLFAFDFEGNQIWAKNLDSIYGSIRQQFGYSSSPLLLDGKLYLPLLHGQWESDKGLQNYTDESSYLLCLDGATGEEVWRVHRPSDARGESFDSYASAMPYVLNGVEAFVVQGGDHLSAHARADGSELWRQAHNPGKETHWRLIPSPVVAGDVVCGFEPRGGGAWGILPGDRKFIPYEESTWIFSENTTDVPTPAYYEGKLYIVNGVRKLLLCLDPATGTELWRGDLEASGRIWASPTVAEGKLYCLDENGQVTIASIADEFKVLSHADFGGGITKSTIAIADSNLFIRTAEKLYCTGP